MSFQINDVSLDHVGLDNRQRGGGAKKNLRQGVGNSAVQNVHTLSTVSLASYANPSAGVTCSGAEGALATASDNNRDWSELLLLTSAQLRAMILPSQLPSIQHAGGGGLVVYPMSKDELDLSKNCDYVLTSTGVTPFGASGYSKLYGTIKTSHNITNACGTLASGVWGASATAGLAGVTSLHLPGKVALANEALGPQNECCNTVQTCCGVQNTCNPCNQWPVNCAPTSKAQVDQNNTRAQCLGARTQEDAHALAVVLFGEDYQCGDSLLLGGRLGIAGVPLISISGGSAANAANATGTLVFNRDGVALNPTAMGRTAENALGPSAVNALNISGTGDAGEAPVVVLNAGGGGDLGLGGNGTALTTGSQNLNACDGVRLFNHGVGVSNLASSNDAARMGKIGYLAPPPELNLVTIVSGSGSVSGTPSYIPSIGNTPDLDFVIRATVVGNSACFNANAPDNCCNPYGGRVGTQQSAALNLRQHPGKSQSTILEFDILKATQRSGFAIASDVGTTNITLTNGTMVTPATAGLLAEVC